MSLARELLRGRTHKRHLFSQEVLVCDFCLAIVLEPDQGCKHCLAKEKKQAESSKAFFEKAKQEKALAGVLSKKRGGPRIHPLPDPNQPKRPRGRPKGSKNKS